MSVGSWAAASDTGRKRRRNEDAYVVAPPLFAVADGMGGAQAGEIASRLAAAALEETAGLEASAAAPPTPGRQGGSPSATGRSLSGPERVASLIQEANRRVHERASSDPSTSGMGTTMTVALVEGDAVSLGHVGDSRAYRVRGGEIEQLTEDHSLVNELLKSGKLSREEAEIHPQRSVITRAVGTDPDVDVDSFTVETREGDVFLLCSDGLTDMVPDPDILHAVERHPGDLDRVAKDLVSAANRGGGEDNITVVAFAIAEAGGDTATMPAVVGGGDEDTLDGARPLPTVDTMVVPPGRVEEVFLEKDEAGELQARRREPVPPAARVRLVLTMLALLAVAAVLLVWGLLR